MSAIERCRTAALGGHVARCENEACGHTLIAYNSCRNRHCPKCQGAAAREWLAEREAELLAVGYFHLVFTLPGPIADIAYQNKRVIYDLLFKAAAETTLTIAADPKHLGARIGITAVLHTWGSAMTHHPHVHMIVPGGGLSADGSRWVHSRPSFFLPVRVLSRLFRRLFLEMLVAAKAADQLKFHGDHLRSPTRRHSPPSSRRCARLNGSSTPSRRSAGPRPYSPTCRATPIASPFPTAASSRPTTPASPSNGRTTASRGARGRDHGRLPTAEFIRRFLMHVLPKGFHRIRHYGLFANGNRAADIARARELLAMPPPAEPDDPKAAEPEELRVHPHPCPCCGGRMIIIEVFARGCQPSYRPTPIRIDTS